MIAVALAVIIAVVAVTCGIVADSNHADTLAFLGVMVKTTAAQIFLAGAICTWALFAAMWLLSAGIRRSKERGLELRLLKALRTRRFPGASRRAIGGAATMAGIAGLVPTSSASSASEITENAENARITGNAGNTGSSGRAGSINEASDGAMSAPVPADSSESAGSIVLADAAYSAGSADSADSIDSADSEPTIDFSDFPDFGGLRALEHGNCNGSGHGVGEHGLGWRAESGRFYRTAPWPDSAEPLG